MDAGLAVGGRLSRPAQGQDLWAFCPSLSRREAVGPPWGRAPSWAQPAQWSELSCCLVTRAQILFLGKRRLSAGPLELEMREVWEVTLGVVTFYPPDPIQTAHFHRGRRSAGRSLRWGRGPSEGQPVRQRFHRRWLERVGGKRLTFIQSLEGSMSRPCSAPLL